MTPRVPKVAKAKPTEKRKNTDEDRLTWLSYLLCDLYGSIDYDIASGCLCGSCWVYTIKWEDELGNEIVIEGECLSEALDKAIEKDPGWVIHL